MPNEIQDILSQITDLPLRARLANAINELKRTKKWGLVFEPHIPELVPIYSAKIRVGTRVALKGKALSETGVVESIANGWATLAKEKDDGTGKRILLAQLVAVRKFGEPIFPALTHVDSVLNRGDAGHHVLIEAENYHALQLLEWLYPGKVDCIYIDPPYNTGGAKDWKYNNNYVDKHDEWRHSKWLAMMQRRLELAQVLLKKEGVLICTIDDNELAHLWMLLHSIFKDRKIIAVTIQHNPGGTQGDNFSVTNEYALFVISEESTIYRTAHPGADTYNLRRWGSTSSRFEAKNCFYPIYVKDQHIIGIGNVPSDTFHPKSQTVSRTDGTREVWPLDKSGNEKKWRYARQTVDGVLDRAFVVERGERTEIILRREDEPPRTVWTDKRFNAEAHGTDLVSSMIQKKFPYPKSLYATLECLSLVTAQKQDALIVDFFAGSGTTLHATALLNATDQGKRRCILVTNNEVSDEETKRFESEGKTPGDAFWEQHGICRSVTFPRCKAAITGLRPDGMKLSGKYGLNQFEERRVTRRYLSLEFCCIDLLKGSSSRKKRLRKELAQAVGYPQSRVIGDEKYLISEGDRVAILFEEKCMKEFVQHGAEFASEIETVYVPVASGSKLRQARDQIEALWPGFTRKSELEREMSEGLPGNLSYFRLAFLDHDSVETGGRLGDILPTLWMMAGARGKVPVCVGNEKMVLPSDANLAILVDENYIKSFLDKLSARANLDWVFLVTNDQEAFSRMCERLPDRVPVNHRIHLWRNYLDNFVINIPHHFLSNTGDGA